MRITALEADGFGVWSNLKLENLSDGLNVFYGANEAGKTTLLEFVRSMLYGFSPTRRRYLPTVAGSRPGGSLHVTTSGGRFQVSRHDNQATTGNADAVTIYGPDGTRQGEHLLKTLLANVDETIFNNVFAVGLRDIQELGTLSDTEAASMLYNLSIGLDRVSLVQVMRELENSRNRLLDQHGGACQVTQLLAQREKLRAEIEDQDTLTRRYARLAAERDQVNREAARLEEDVRQLQQQTRITQIALVQFDRWHQRAALDEQLAAMGPVEMIPDGTLERLGEVGGRLKKHQDAIVELKRQQEEIRLETEALELNETLWRLAPRVEALKEQEGWVATLEKQVAELEKEIGQLEGQMTAAQQRFGLDGKDSGGLASLSSRSLMALRSPGRAVSRYRRQLEEAKQEVAKAREMSQTLTAQVDNALKGRGDKDLTQATDRIGALVTQLRRRVQLDERIEQMGRYLAESEEQCHQLLQHQLLPVPMLAGLGAAFVVGVILMMAGLFIPATILGSWGWPLAFLGLMAVGVAVAAKFMIERTSRQRLEDSQKQVNMLQLQLKQATQERDVLDQQLPKGGGPMTLRLQTAEKELATLEELVPLNARRQAAQQEAEAAAERVRQAEQGLSVAHRRWREALTNAGLPQNLTPKQARDLVGRSDDVADTQRRLDRRYEEVQQRNHELESLKARIRQLASDCRVPLKSDQPIEQIHELVQALDEQETRLKSRDAFQVQARQLRHVRTKHEAALDRLRRRRKELLREAGVGDEDTLRQRVTEIERTAELRRERQTLQREIEAAIAGCCTEQALGEQLKEATRESLEARCGQFEQRWKAAETQLQKRFESRGRLNEQLKTLVEDRSPAIKQLTLAMQEKKLEEAIGRWRALAVTGRLLQSIRRTYEEDRQPETLREASRYLDRMTEGRYRRVWTPLGEDVLLVDDAKGKSLAIDLLSQGTREQLFLSLRMALASSYAQRGAALPMVLDDVLVNFDTHRAQAAASVLHEFAQSGHQLFVFSCHEHIMHLFAAMQVHVTELRQGEAPRIVSTPAVEKPVKKPARRRPEPEPEAEPEASFVDDEPQELIAEEEPRKTRTAKESPKGRQASKAKELARPKQAPAKRQVEGDAEEEDEVREPRRRGGRTGAKKERVAPRKEEAVEEDEADETEEEEARRRGLAPWEAPWGEESDHQSSSEEDEELDEEETEEVDEAEDEDLFQEEDEDEEFDDGLFDEESDEEDGWDDEDDSSEDDFDDDDGNEAA
jgi:uncharacterized protein YhaN